MRRDTTNPIYSEGVDEGVHMNVAAYVRKTMEGPLDDMFMGPDQGIDAELAHTPRLPFDLTISEFVDWDEVGKYLVKEGDIIATPALGGVQIQRYTPQQPR